MSCRSDDPLRRNLRARGYELVDRLDEQGSTMYCGSNCNHTGPHRYPPALAARSEPGAEGLAPARVGGYRRLSFDNGRYEEYQAVFVQHGASEWDRILIARDDGTIAATLVALINGVATPAADSRGLDVEAAALALGKTRPVNRHSQLCPVWTRRSRKRTSAPTLADCDCWIMVDARLDAAVILAALTDPDPAP